LSYPTNGLILLIDDDRRTRRWIRSLLQQEGYRVSHVPYDAEALGSVGKRSPDAVLVRLGFADVTEAEVCRRLRRQTAAPIIVLSTRSAEADKIVVLNAGADAHLTEPVSPGELTARLRAALRRSRGRAGTAPPAERLAAGDVLIDVAAHRVYIRGREIHLTGRTFALLQLLVAHAGQVIERADIYTTVWGPDFVGHQSNLDVYIRLLRRQIEQDPAHPRLIETVPHLGYRFVAEPSALLDAAGRDGCQHARIGSQDRTPAPREHAPRTSGVAQGGVGGDASR
jgi:two-component system KDP operon response regulator KdpE